MLWTIFPMFFFSILVMLALYAGHINFGKCLHRVPRPTMSGPCFERGTQSITIVRVTNFSVCLRPRLFDARTWGTWYFINVQSQASYHNFQTNSKLTEVIFWGIRVPEWPWTKGTPHLNSWPNVNTYFEVICFVWGLNFHRRHCPASLSILLIRRKFKNKCNWGRAVRRYRQWTYRAWAMAVCMCLIGTKRNTSVCNDFIGRSRGSDTWVTT